MDITVTIVNWNRADMLARCLYSVLQSKSSSRIEVIVVDNASSDGSVKMVRERFPSIRLIQNAENFGFGCAHNQAITEARGRYVLILNNDAALLPETIEKLVAFMDAHPQAAICTCPARPSASSAWITGGGMKHFPSVTRETICGFLAVLIPPTEWPGSDQIVKLLQRINGNCNPSQEQEVAWCKGALLLVRRSSLVAIGGFDERYFMYYEDVDLSLRARKAGWSVWQTPVTSYLHDSGQSMALRMDKERIWSTNGFRYFHKNQGLYRALLWRGQNYIFRQGVPTLREGLRRLLRNTFHFGSRAI